jgi:hypothetical protein
MPWWGWIVVGTLLLGGELLVPTDFYLVFIGVAGMLVGLLVFLAPALPTWGQWALFGVLAIGLLVFFRRWLHDRFPGQGARARLGDALVGEIGVLQEPIAPGAVGRVELRGSPWSARNAGETPLEAGARARVLRVEGFTLHIVRET